MGKGEVNFWGEGVPTILLEIGHAHLPPPPKSEYMGPWVPQLAVLQLRPHPISNRQCLTEEEGGKSGFLPLPLFPERCKHHQRRII